MKPSFIVAGIFSGIAGLLVFLVIHHIWILPIWFILPVGLVISCGGGLAVGWAYQEILPGLPPRPWTHLAMIALIGLILLPSIILAELRQPMFDANVPGGLMVVSTRQAVLHFILELLVTSAIVGALAGWWIGHKGRAVLATALAGFAFALGPGHNIPFLGGTPGNIKGIALLLAIITVSVVVLVEVQARLAQWGEAPGFTAGRNSG